MQPPKYRVRVVIYDDEAEKNVMSFHQPLLSGEKGMEDTIDQLCGQAVRSWAQKKAEFEEEYYPDGYNDSVSEF